MTACGFVMNSNYPLKVTVHVCLAVNLKKMGNFREIAYWYFEKKSLQEFCFFHIDKLPNYWLLVSLFGQAYLKYFSQRF